MKDKLQAIAAALIVLSSLALGTPSFIKTLKNGDAPGDAPNAAYFEKRFAPAKKLLPTGETTGYFSDVQPDIPRTIRFLHARLALAPRTLAFSADGDHILADFTGGGKMESFAELKNHEVEKDLGGGLLLLRKKKP